MNYKIKNAEKLRTVIAGVPSSTVIEAGDLVSKGSNGLITKATNASVALAYAITGSPSGSEVIEITVGNDFTLYGTADANFAISNRGTNADLVDNTNQLIDLGTHSTNVLKVSISTDAGTVGSTSDVEVRIDKPIF